MVRSLVAVLAALAAAPVVPAREEVPVDLELVLAVDVSWSMDMDEQRLQREGYVAAMSDPEVVAAAAMAGAYGRIAVTYVEWGGPGGTHVRVPWRLIDGAASAKAFAEDLAEAPIGRLYDTSISNVLAFAAALFDANGFAGLRRVIDVSGDGPNNTGEPVVPVRDALIDQGIVINGLPLMLRPWGPAWANVPGLDVYYEDCVVGGPGAFVIPVQVADELANAIRRKLVLEIAGPEPGPIPAARGLVAERLDCLIGEKMRRAWRARP